MDFRTKFTKWYYRKGYKIDYADGIGRIVYICPWWVKPLTAYFFSPSAYFQEALADIRMRLDEEDKNEG
jgi:hypothetical protein